MKKILAAATLLFCTLHLNAQTNDTLYNLTQTICHRHWGMIDSAANIRAINFIAPALCITYGALALKNNALDQLNFSTRAEIKEDHPFFRTHIDNYFQYAPGAAVFALQALGVKGKNTAAHEAIIYATSLGIAAAVITPLKHWTHELRPDSSNYYSFPSGHTTTAFASAEFLRIEYGHTSPWIAVAGYAAATATAAFRLYNNKHWFSDVVAGAGFGVLSTDLAYWLNDKILWRKKTNTSLSVFPTYNNGNFGLALVKVF